ncbi:MAG: DUF5658 family protein [Vicinamibacterales bacterium]|nr:DUF5658 family protein [Vicinamibacterales bacterium]
MKIKRTLALAVVVGLSFSSAAFAAEKEDARLERERRLDAAQQASTMTPMAGYVPEMKRPTALTALYATLGAMQAWDVYSTTAALKAGATEANPMAAPFAGNTGSMLGMKAATTVGTIFFAERMWKKNKVGAIVMMVAINSATAAVSMHNMHNAHSR